MACAPRKMVFHESGYIPYIIRLVRDTVYKSDVLHLQLS